MDGMTEILSPPDDLAAALKDERLRRLLAYWEGKRRGRRFPSRADIDPLDFPYAMGWINLVQVEYRPLRFKFRIHGTSLIAKNQYDLTGKYLDEHPLREIAEYCHRVWSDTLARQAPTHGFYDQEVEGRARKCEALRLPLSGDGATIDLLLICTVF